jgi:hypothetical protein
LEIDENWRRLVEDDAFEVEHNARRSNLYYEVVCTANVSLPRPDLEAHRNSLLLPLPEVLHALTLNIGKKLTAFIASADDTEMVDGLDRR